MAKKDDDVFLDLVSNKGKNQRGTSNTSRKSTNRSTSRSARPSSRPSSRPTTQRKTTRKTPTQNRRPSSTSRSRKKPQSPFLANLKSLLFFPDKNGSSNRGRSQARSSKELVFARRRTIGAIVVIAIVLLLLFIGYNFVSYLHNRTASLDTNSSNAAEQQPVVYANCTDDDITLSLVSDSGSITQGEKTTFTTRVQQSTQVACMVNVDPSHEELRIYRGSRTDGEEVYNSSDCAEDVDRPLLMSKGDVENYKHVWNTQPSSKDTCEVKKKFLPEAEYTAIVSLTLLDGKTLTSRPFNFVIFKKKEEKKKTTTKKHKTKKVTPARKEN